MKRNYPLTLALSVVFLLGAGNTFAGGKYLYIQSNNIGDGQNSVIGYERHKDGTLTPHPAGPFMTAGAGFDNNTNGKLGPNDNDSPIAVSPDKKWLFAANGHSNTIAVFDIQSDGSLKHVNGSPFDSQGVQPVSLAISNDVLVVANRNEDPHQLDALRGGAYANYASFKINQDGTLKFLSKIELTDGYKNTQVLVSSRNPQIVFGNDFQVDADFDGEGNVSKLFGNEQHVRGRLNTLMVSTNPGHLHQVDQQAVPETVTPAPDVPSIPLGIWDHPKKNLVYAGLVTRNQLGVYSYDHSGKLTFVAAVDNSGQDICWLKTNKKGTRLYAVNNLPRAEQGDKASTVTVFDISGKRAEKPVEIGRAELPLPLGTFINNRNSEQPNSAAFQFDIDDREKYLYVISQRINQTAENTNEAGNILHTLKIRSSGKLSVVDSRHLAQDGVSHRARPQGVVSIDL
ncbi:MAG: beta-propeller fold lactonase family protein [Gammaproteobacteria bacterium]|nr:beta-propeller fold lactonase family protein [Gammaproteobacteria bacterium]